MDKKIKVGVIGCGGIANFKHIPSIRGVNDVEIVGLCDILPEQIANTKKNFPELKDVKEYSDYKELLKDPEIEAVHVCTPNREHSFITIDALHAGKHVICEKPMAKTYAEAVEMCKAAKEAGKILTIGYQGRYRKEMLYAKQRIEQGELGEIYYARAHAIRRRAIPNWGVFLNEEEQGGGPLIDIGTHALDLTLWQMNNYRPVMVMGQSFKKLCRDGSGNYGNAFGGWNEGDFTVEDSAFGMVRMENGAVIYLEASWALNNLDVFENNTTLCGTKAGIDFRDGLRINKIVNNAQVVEKVCLDAGGVDFYDGSSSGTAEQNEANCFYGAIRGKNDLIVKPEQAACVTMILEAIYKSAKDNKAVYFKYDAEGNVCISE